MLEQPMLELYLLEYEHGRRVELSIAIASRVVLVLACVAIGLARPPSFLHRILIMVGIVLFVAFSVFWRTRAVRSRHTIRWALDRYEQDLAAMKGTEEGAETFYDVLIRTRQHEGITRIRFSYTLAVYLYELLGYSCVLACLLFIA